MSDEVAGDFPLRQGRKQPKNLYLFSNAYPEGELVGQCQLIWVAEEIVRRWNLQVPTEMEPGSEKGWPATKGYCATCDTNRVINDGHCLMCGEKML